MRLWVDIDADGIVRGLMMADSGIPRDAQARELGEWVLDGTTPRLYDFGDGPAKVNAPLLSTARQVVL